MYSILVRFGTFSYEVCLFDQKAFCWEGGFESRVPWQACDFIKIPQSFLETANISIMDLEKSLARVITYCKVVINKSQINGVNFF